MGRFSHDALYCRAATRSASGVFWGVSHKDAELAQYMKSCGQTVCNASSAIASSPPRLCMFVMMRPEAASIVLWATCASRLEATCEQPCLPP